MKDWRGPPLSKLLVLCYCPPLWIFSWTNPFLPSSSSSKFQYWDSGGQFDNHAIKFYFQCRVVELRWNPDISGKIQNLQIVRNPREGMTWPRSPGEKEEEAVIVYLTSWGWSSDLFAQLVGYLNFIEIIERNNFNSNAESQVNLRKHWMSNRMIITTELLAELIIIIIILLCIWW